MFHYLAQATYDFSTNSSSSSSFLSAPVLILILALVLIIVVAQWKVFTKAGKPGWASIVPVYSSYVLLDIVGMPTWIAFLTLIPFVNFVASIALLVAYFKLGKAFGKGTGFSIMLVLFPYITIPILGFGKAQFNGAPAASAPTPGMPPAEMPAAPMPPTVTDVPPAAPMPPSAPTPPEPTPPMPPTDPTPPAAPTPGV